MDCAMRVLESETLVKSLSTCLTELLTTDQITEKLS